VRGLADPLFRFNKPRLSDDYSATRAMCSVETMLNLAKQSTHPPLVFVYTGNPLPDFLVDNLIGTANRYPGPVIALTDRPRAIDNVEVQDISRWYSPERFHQFVDASPLDPYFRGGFWLRAAERFFVLEQYMDYTGLEKIFHVEADVMVLDLNDYAAFLDNHGDGIFAPMEAKQRAYASLMYVNSLPALRALCDFTIERADLGNEMTILGHFLTDHPDMGHCLPSD